MGGFEDSRRAQRSGERRGAQHRQGSGDCCDTMSARLHEFWHPTGSVYACCDLGTAVAKHLLVRRRSPTGFHGDRFGSGIPR